MAQRNEAQERNRRPSASTGIAVVVSLVFLSTAAGLHSHADTAELPLSCTVCASTHQAPLAAAQTAPASAPPASPWQPPMLEPRIGVRWTPVLLVHTRGPPSIRSF